MATENLIFEACVETLEEAIAAEKRGACRIELCSALDRDGLTPSPELTMLCIQRLKIPIRAMVRPRAGEFAYSETEIRQMEAMIEFFKQAGVEGVVFGLLTNAGTIDIENTTRLTKLAYPLKVTFHKAIDSSTDVMKSFQELNWIDGITSVLTSGGKDTAWNGRFVLKQMQELPDRRIQIIAAGKVIQENLHQIAEFTGIAELHGRRIV